MQNKKLPPVYVQKTKKIKYKVMIENGFVIFDLIYYLNLKVVLKGENFLFHLYYFILQNLTIVKAFWQ